MKKPKKPKKKEKKNSKPEGQGVAVTHSPLWRVTFYGCSHLARLRVNDDDTLNRRRREIDKILTEAGLDIIGQGTIKYSEDGAHGYTYVTGLLQSGAMMHTYPDDGLESVTIVFETCGPVKRLVKKAVKAFTWYFGAADLVWQTLPPVPLQSTAILDFEWKKRKKKLRNKAKPKRGKKGKGKKGRKGH